MKLVLVSLRSPFLDDEYVFPYLGILHLMSIALLRAEVIYEDAFDFDHLEKYEDADAICISAFTPQALQAYSIREAFPDKKIIIGGSHATYYSDICAEKGFNVIVQNDGEQVFSNLLDNLSSLSERGIIIDGGFLKSESLDVYPLPCRDSEVLNKYNYLLDGEKATTIVTSRGCPNSCSFCESAKTKCRIVPEVRFFMELVQIVAFGGYRRLMIFDDLFTWNVTTLERKASILKKFKEHYGLRYRCFTHAERIREYPIMVDILKESGCIEVGFGGESANQSILDRINKRIVVKDLYNLIDEFTKKNIRVKGFFILGLPGETRETIDETYKFLRWAKENYGNMFDFDYTIWFPFRGTSARSEIEKGESNIRLRKGLTWEQLDRGNFGAYKKRQGTADCVIETDEVSAEELIELQQRTLEVKHDYQD